MKVAEDGSVAVNIVQGEQRVTEDPGECVSTLLGSCVAACLHDPYARVGGMNHFLLPGGEGDGGQAERFSVHAMELLVNALLARGASRARLEAKLFGGANTMQGLSDIGAMNAGFAVRFLGREGISLSSSCLGGDRGRRIQFWPVSGRARRRFMMATDAVPMPRAASLPLAPSAGALELF